MKVYACEYGEPKDDESNEFLLKIAKYLDSLNDDDPRIIAIHEKIRIENNMSNRVFTIGTNKDYTKACLAFFDVIPCGKVYKVFIDEERKPYIEV